MERARFLERGAIINLGKSACTRAAHCCYTSDRLLRNRVAATPTSAPSRERARMDLNRVLSSEFTIVGSIKKGVSVKLFHFSVVSINLNRREELVSRGSNSVYFLRVLHFLLSIMPAR